MLKGATVLPLWVHEDHRSTRDLDFLGTGAFDEPSVLRMIRDISLLAVPDDGIRFDPHSIAVEPIRESNEYHGFRVRMTCTLGRAVIRLQLDIGLGDIVTPRAPTAELPAILPGMSASRLKVYPPETIVAEKFQALVKLGIANSRMKDYFDLFILAKERAFEGELLRQAVERTFRRRRTVMPEKEPVGLSTAFFRDTAKQTQWRAFLAKTGSSAPADFMAVATLLRRFLIPVWKSCRGGDRLEKSWRGNAWRAATS